MRVLVISRRLTRSLSAPHYALELTQSLIANGCEVLLLTSSSKITIYGAQVIRFPSIFAKRELSPVAYSLFAKYIKKKYDVDIVHGHGYTLFDDVTTVHSLRRAFEHKVMQLGLQISFGKEASVERLIFKSSRHLIAPSKMAKNYLIRFYGIEEEDITVVHSGVNTNKFTPPTPKEKALARKKLHLNDEDIYVGFVGPPHWKGLQYLIHSLAITREPVRVLAVNSAKPRYISLSRRLGVRGRVKLLPKISDMPTFYKAIDVFVLPSIYDTFPLSVLEAMSSGLPVIVSSNTGSSDIIQEGENGFVLSDPRDVHLLARLIDFLSENERLRKRVGIAARKTAEELSWFKVGAKVVKVYNSILER